jgi:hypothetical protein
MQRPGLCGARKTLSGQRSCERLPWRRRPTYRWSTTIVDLEHTQFAFTVELVLYRAAVRPIVPHEVNYRQ